MKLNGIMAVVFDFDGTLATCPYDFAHMRRAVLQTAAAYGIDPETLGHVGLLETIETGVELLAADPSRAAQFREEATGCLCAIEMEAAAHTYLLTGVVEALATLRAAGLRLGIVTRNSAAAVAQIIGDVPLPVDAMLCREDVALPKPHPAHALEMLRLLDSAPATSVMVGDHPMDIEMGHAAGMATVAVLTGQSNAEILGAANPGLLLPSVLELTALLLQRDVTPAPPQV